MTKTTGSKENRPNHGALSVKEIMKIFKLSYQTVNHYTDFGLLPVPQKRGNVRFYDKRLVESRLKKIKELLVEGYSLRLIRKKLIGV
ncbi:MAG: helix-turn-helix domain-containing protein [Candidatus Omnitrophota bacterium]